MLRVSNFSSGLCLLSSDLCEDPWFHEQQQQQQEHKCEASLMGSLGVFPRLEEVPSTPCEVTPWLQPKERVSGQVPGAKSGFDQRRQKTLPLMVSLSAKPPRKVAAEVQSGVEFGCSSGEGQG
mmetsp:Transcript_56466/g.134577  ORF Transcript_56466/g.134577 Transcript_56466/m.134577 type:complete len:123 (-) Transcript_56466:217-585(-)